MDGTIRRSKRRRRRRKKSFPELVGLVIDAIYGSPFFFCVLFACSTVITTVWSNGTVTEFVAYTIKSIIGVNAFLYLCYRLLTKEESIKRFPVFASIVLLALSFVLASIRGMGETWLVFWHDNVTLLLFAFCCFSVKIVSVTFGISVFIVGLCNVLSICIEFFYDVFAILCTEIGLGEEFLAKAKGSSFGIIDNSNQFGMLNFVAIAMLTYLTAKAINKRHYIAVLLNSILTVFFAVMIIPTGCRTAAIVTLVFFVMVFLYASVLFFARCKKKIIVKILIYAAMLVILCVLIIALYHLTIAVISDIAGSDVVSEWSWKAFISKNYTDEKIAENLSSLSDRIPIWKYALETAGDNALLGVGQENIRELLKEHFKKELIFTHNSFIEPLLAHGYIYFTLLAIVYLTIMIKGLIYAIRSIFKNEDTQYGIIFIILVALSIYGMAECYLFGYACSISILFWCCAGLLFEKVKKKSSQ